MCDNCIPKIIHYCWFGGNPLSELAQKCIKSWKKYCPDYEIKRWDETNFDINYNIYVREAYDSKKWAFVTDVVRLYALVNYGGIYMDTDVEVLKPLDDFLQFEAFSGFESDTQIPTGIMASVKGQKLFVELLDEYKGLHFIGTNGILDTTTNVIRITNTCLKYGFVPNNQKQIVNGFALFPKDYFCPKDYCTRVTEITENTYTIHHFDGSWESDENKYAVILKNKFVKLPIPKIITAHIAKFIAVCKFRGFKAAIEETVYFIRKKQNDLQ